MKHLSLVLVTFFLILAGGVAADEIATLRDGASIEEEPDTKRMSQVVDLDIRSKRNYPMQPPLIPHDIRGYDVNLQVNRCMACHARGRIEDSQAPMVSVTHFMDREGNFLAQISPRRYFCNQCHVVQTGAPLLVENDFQDMDDIIAEKDRAGRDD